MRRESRVVREELLADNERIISRLKPETRSVSFAQEKFSGMIAHKFMGAV